MARERSPARDEARRVWLESGGTMTARQVAESVGTTPAQVRKWKSADGWQAALDAQKPPRKRGGQPGERARPQGTGMRKHTAHIPRFALTISSRNSGHILRA